MKQAPWVPFFHRIDTLGRPEQNGAKKMDLTNVGCNRQSIYRILATFAICYMGVYTMYLSQMLVDLGACMEAPCTPLADRDRFVMFSVTVGYIQ